MKSVSIIYYNNNQRLKIRKPLQSEDVEIHTFSLSRDREAIEDRIVNIENQTLGKALNSIMDSVKSDYILFIDNDKNHVSVKESALDLFLLTSQRHPDLGFIYTDYDIKSKNETEEVHLLHPHRGRVRDNQDYGRVFFIRSQALLDVGGFDENLKYNTLYDMRLKLTEKHKPVHISNRYSGALYTVYTAKSTANVFDYLLASKDAQVEAEHVITGHLKRLGAYLAPQQGYKKRPADKTDPTLVASVIIPVNDRPGFIGTAIESVQAQTVKDVEVIVVVNGGANDTTIPEVEKYRLGGEYYDANKPQVHLIVLDINNIGMCLNMGSLHAKGNYYVQLDSDDRLKPDAVEKIVEVYNSDEHIGMVIGSYEVWEKKGSGDLVRMEEIPVVTHDEWTEDNGRNNLLRINGAGAPRSIPIQLIKDIGYFGMNDDPYARNYGEDYDMVLHISEHYKIGRVWDPIYEVIRHSGGTDHAIDQHTVDRNDNAKDHMRLEAIRRRQALNGY